MNKHAASSHPGGSGFFVFARAPTVPQPAFRRGGYQPPEPRAPTWCGQLWCNGCGAAVRRSGVKYLYSGFTSKWRVYSSTTTPPTEPGRYVVTVCIIGGNHMAAPITRSFQITK